MAVNNLIPRPVLKAARRGVACMVLQTMLKIEVRTPDPAERWRVLRRVLGMMVRGEV